MESMNQTIHKHYIVKDIEDGNLFIFPSLDAFRVFENYVLLGVCFGLAANHKQCSWLEESKVSIGDVAAAYGGGRYEILDVVYFDADDNEQRAINGNFYIVPKHASKFFNTLIQQRRKTKLKDSYGHFIVTEDELDIWRNGQKIEARAKVPAEKLIVGSVPNGSNLKVEDFDDDGDVAIIPSNQGHDGRPIYLNKGGVNELIKYLTKCLENAKD